MKTSKQIFLSLAVIFVLLFQLMSPVQAQADDDRPPAASETPVETSLPETTEVPTEATATETPTVTDTPVPTDSLTPEPTDDTASPEEPESSGTATDEPASPTADPVEVTALPAEPVAVTPEPVETLTSETPADAAQPTISDVLQQVPDGTSVVVLDESGQPLPLALQETADIAAEADPIWCPAGVAPGGAGCTGSYTSFGSLLADLSALNGGAGVDADGTIWIESSYISAVNDPAATGFSLDGTALTTWATHSLSLQGGWSGILGDTSIGSNSVFSVPITISNWNNTVYLGNITTTTLNVNDTSGVVILADVQANDINLNRQRGRVDVYNSTGNLNITNADINNGGLYSAGVNIHTLNGDVSITDSVFHGNGYDGVWMDNVRDVTLSNSTFSPNGNNGVGISNAGNVFIDRSSFDGNGWMGASITSAGDVTVSDSTFNNNLFHGIYVAGATGNVDLANISSTANPGAWGDGAYIDNTAGTGDVILTGTNDFSNHSAGNSGMFILSNGAVSLSGITSNNNGRGVNISQSGSVTITGGTFNDNCCNYEGTGAYVLSFGNVTITQSRFNRNSLYVNSRGNVFTNNVTVSGAPGVGIGVETQGGDITLTNSRVINSIPNYSVPIFPYGDGADIFPNGGNVTVTDSEFSGNDWGLWVVNGNQVTITRSIFDSNVPPTNLVDLAVSCTLAAIGLSFPEGIPISTTVNPDCTYTPPVTVVNNRNQEVTVTDLSSTVKATMRGARFLAGSGSRNLAYSGRAEFFMDCRNQKNSKVNLPNGDRVDIYCPVSGKVTITRLDNTTLPSELPTGYTFASAFEVKVLQPDVPLIREPGGDYVRHPIPVIREGGHIMAAFVATPLQPGREFSILYWDENTLRWIPLKDFLVGSTFKLVPEDPNDDRVILTGVLPNLNSVPRRVQVTTNFPGTFVLAQH